MKNLYSVESRVLEILETSEEARNDDMKLYVLVCNSCYQPTNVDIGKLPFEVVMTSYKALNIPHFESVRRARAKIQAAHPELACSPEVRKARKKCERMYANFVKN